jgi:hypothetical protein
MSRSIGGTNLVTAALPGIVGELHGRPTRRIETAHCWLEFLSEGGPRIVGFGLAGDANVLAETPNAHWDTGYGMFELVGGHRLWFAPESPECSVPDMSGLTVSLTPLGIRLTGAVQEPTGLCKSIEIGLAPDSAAVRLHHVVANEGERTLELSPWPVTQLRLGGVARVEMPALGQGSAPNQLVAMFPYSSWDDERLSIRQRELAVTATPGPPFKIGVLNRTGVVSYEVDGLRFVKRYDPALDRPHPDLGCNLLIYADARTIELESLGTLVRLGPGESVGWDEDWELSRR